MLATVLVVVFCAVGATGYVLGRGKSRPAAAPTVGDKLTTPPSIIGGAFVYDPQVGVPITNNEIAGYAADGIRNPQATGAHYYSSASRQLMVFNGAWGTIDNPAQAVDRAFAWGARQAAADKTLVIVTGLGAPREMSRSGLGDAVMKCQMFKAVQSAHPSGPATTNSSCIWADHSTLGMVSVRDDTRPDTGLTLDEDADMTVKVRNDTRVPAA
ncbi:hypothetical protein [Streptomyces sp. CBMA152]|uniref:hypothetical protein n=1 Tax=Streptomyces sp. CBMA152 TaxID=1896312 RepID=UPI001660EF35|nr:hypothetical protein [Streptomyces sp. CBMA152]MBD0743098.1 hypothetical protein [Streptomyces sp. CBMA152]